MKKLIVILLSIYFTSYAAAQKAPVTIPDFTFYLLQNNQPFKQDKLPSSGYIIFNYYDPGCGHCQKMAAGIAKNIDKFSKSQIYFVTINDKPYVDGFIEMYIPALKNRKNVVFLHDKDIEFIPKFNPTQYPSVYLYDAKTKKLIRHFDGEEDARKLVTYLK
ncbi:Uncharacterised protein [Sphingobacterium spiritivorum]|uniref:Thioredoxin domain-containing protein n=1 Tax=Sphingobacterium spiritivorum TaxID=258 RepID=A0A380CLV8_SPHSI|nr:thioredoxin domain-containing protein [Sphingobacterium spiritivorum]SUJ23972.1 Uncharacterised protein [Sphingobacterium spiritivorum]